MYETIYNQNKVLYKYNKVHPILEIIRHRFLKKLYNDFYYLCKKYNNHIIKPKTDDIFSRFIWKNTLYIDPVIPYREDKYDYLQFKIDLKNYKCNPEELLDKLNLEDTIKKFMIKYDQFYNNYDFNKSYKIIKDTNKMVLKYKGHTVKYNDKILNKLIKYYNGKKHDKAGIIFCELYRYDYLDADNQQLAINIDFKNDLTKFFGVNIEMFGSGINRFFKNYCSLFYDIEQFFGSLGNFFTIEPIQGLFMSNPPYDEDLMESMARHLVKCLDKTDKPLGFIITVPIWDGKMSREISNECNSKINNYEYYGCKEVIIKSKYFYREYAFCAKDFPYYNIKMDKMINTSNTYIYIIKNNLMEINTELFENLLIKHNLKFVRVNKN